MHQLTYYFLGPISMKYDLIKIVVVILERFLHQNSRVIGIIYNFTHIVNSSCQSKEEGIGIVME